MIRGFVFCTPTKVEAYNLEQEGCPLICRFGTMGTVRNIQYSKIGKKKKKRVPLKPWCDGPVLQNVLTQVFPPIASLSSPLRRLPGDH